MFLKRLKTMLLVFVCTFLFLPQIAMASEDYSITIRSTYQVSEGGNPEYTITNEKGESQKVIVSTNEGTTVHVPKGVYKIREVKTTEGFTPQVKKDVEISLPHVDEKGDYHTSVVIEMKSEKYTKPIDPVVPGKTKEEPKKTITEDGTPKELDKRDEEPVEEPVVEEEDEIEEIDEEPEIEDIETPEEKEETPVETTKDNPKTGDTTFKLEIAGLVLIAVLGVLIVRNNKKAKNIR